MGTPRRESRGVRCLRGGSAGGGRRKLARVPFDGLFVDADDVAEVVEGVIAIACVLRFPVPASLRAVVDRGAGKDAAHHGILEFAQKRQEKEGG